MKTILHCDLNNFFASVECILNPALKDLPVAVCGDPEKRHGIVLAKNMLAKKCGIKTAETIWSAKQKCKNLVCVHPQLDKYVYYSEIVKNIYYRYTDRIEPYGIDECWLDVTNSLNLFISGMNIAKSIRNDILNETGLTVSIGISFTKVFAKLGSDLKKPDAITEITLENFKEIIYPLPVQNLFMIGKKTAQKLKSLNIFTLSDLALCDENLLISHFGKNGKKIKESVLGIEYDKVSKFDSTRNIKSVGHGTTTSKDVANFEDFKVVIYYLAELTATRLRKYGLNAKCVALTLRDKNLFSFTRQETLSYNITSASDMAKRLLILRKKTTILKPCRRFEP
ncbi:MAG: DNA polymerase IV [Firmicutes bacterium]|nr:DNA polymerase IV [Bacillota bacterium]